MYQKQLEKLFVLKDWCGEAANFPGNDDWHPAPKF